MHENILMSLRYAMNIINGVYDIFKYFPLLLVCLHTRYDFLIMQNSMIISSLPMKSIFWPRGVFTV